MSTRKKGIKNCLHNLVIGTVSLLMASLLHAHSPMWTYSAPSPAQLTISDGMMATIQYIVTNQSVRPKNLQLKATPGLSASACVLPGKGSSCTLIITVDGSQLSPEGLHSGPILCAQNNPHQCYQATAGNQLNITKEQHAPSLILNGSPLILTAGSGSGTITVTNTSTTITAYNITADFTGTALMGHVAQDASLCVSLPPGQSCALTFTPDTTQINQVNFPIKGENTQQVTGSISLVLPTQAPISIVGSPLTLITNGGDGFITVTNQSTILIATNISADLTNTALDGNVIQDATSCLNVPPQQSCTLTFTPGATIVPASAVTIQGSNTSQATANIEINIPPASISISGSPLTLTADGNADTITVTNTSATATAYDIAADFTNTALANHVTQDASQCATLLPNQSCTLIFTPDATAITQVSFPIKGSNTPQMSGAIEVVWPTQAPISISGSPLTLQTNGSDGSLTVTNQSTLLTATNISANLTSTALEGNVVQDATDCLSVLPQQSCTLTFTPGATVVSSTTVTIQGSNTSQTTASIAINPQQASLSITGGQTMTLNTNDNYSTGLMIIKNNSTVLTATNITANFASTALNGRITQNSSECVSVLPGASCTLRFTRTGSTTVSATNFGVSGTNTTQVTGNLTIDTIPTGLSIGASLAGGLIASPRVTVTTVTNCGTMSTTRYLIAAPANTIQGIQWGGQGTAININDTTNGYANTQSIVSRLGTSTSYAALTCVNYQIDENGNTPCQSGVCYQGWYLPARTELECLYDNKVAVGGDQTQPYWAANENTSSRTDHAWYIYFYDGGPNIRYKGNGCLGRCVRSIAN